MSFGGVRKVQSMTAEEFSKLAHSLAYECATGYVESGCMFAGESLGCTDWFELPSDAAELASMDEPLKYLEARGLIERHPHNANWVALIDESEAAR